MSAQNGYTNQYDDISSTIKAGIGRPADGLLTTHTMNAVYKVGTLPGMAYLPSDLVALSKVVT
jgi:hypothetical protein